MKNNLSFLERTFTKTGTVVGTRAWQPATFFEIDLHLPDIDMSGWKDAQHIKCKVGPFTYRDYTPAYWDTDTHTCTLYIDAMHDGAGSRWAKGLQQGDVFCYVGLGSSHQQPEKNMRHVFLGDKTAIGHFAALQQLAGKTAEITGAVMVKEDSHREAFTAYFPRLAMQPVADVTKWVDNNQQHNNAVFYLAGNNQLVISLRKQLRSIGYNSKQIKAQGFWH